MGIGFLGLKQVDIAHHLRAADALIYIFGPYFFTSGKEAHIYQKYFGKQHHHKNTPIYKEL